jgi:Nucleotidyltransferase
MRTPGVPDPQYVVARTVLLDALEALGTQREAIVVVGAQAIYLHTGTVELAVPEFTIDADLTIDPTLLRDVPEIESALRAAHFQGGNRVGAWIVHRDIDGVTTKIEVDLMVPEAVGGGGRRAARLGGHAKEVARKARGLEAALVDKATMTIGALDTEDRRTLTVAVAGPTALLISKLHKIAERASERQQRRVDDKDALDVLRLVQGTGTARLAATMVKLLQVNLTRNVTREALTVLADQFSSPRAPGARMAVRAAGPLMPADEVAQSCAALASDLVRATESIEA